MKRVTEVREGRGNWEGRKRQEKEVKRNRDNEQENRQKRRQMQNVRKELLLEIF